MVREIDQDSNGEIDFDEFVAVMSRKVNANFTKQDIIQAFEVRPSIYRDVSSSILDVTSIELRDSGRRR